MQELAQTGPNIFVWQTPQKECYVPTVKPFLDTEKMLERAKVLKSMNKSMY